MLRTSMVIIYLLLRSRVLYCAFLILIQQLVLGQTMELIVLGTSQDAGTPQIACDQPCCSERWKNKETSSVACLGFSDGERFYMIDATPDFPVQFMEAQSHFVGQSFGGIFLTHAHIGHYTGLMYLGREAMGASNVPVYCMPRMKAFLEENGPWSQLVTLGNIELVELSPLQAVPLSDELHITALPVPHRDEFSETVGYRIEAQRSLFYVPDIDKWEVWEHPIEDVIAEVDYALLDGTFYNGDELPGRDLSEIPHPFVVESLKRFEKLSTDERDKIHFTHLNHSNPLHDPNSQASNVVVSFGAHVAQKDMVFDLKE